MAATQQCDVIRVDKKTSLIVYRDAPQGSILTNPHEVIPQQSFASTLKSIFSPSSSNIFSAEAAANKQEAERKKILGSGMGVESKGNGTSTASLTSSSSGGGGSSPRVNFAPLPEAERPRGRSASISCGVSARAALLRGETPTARPKASTSDAPPTPEAEEAPFVESSSSDEESTADEEGKCKGRAICRNATITKENSSQHPVNSPSSASEEEGSGKWSDKLRKSFKRRSSSTSSINRQSSTITPQATQPRRPVVYEVVSNEEADKMVEKGGARRGTADLKVVPEHPREEQWLEEAVDYKP